MTVCMYMDIQNFVLHA